MALVNHHVLVEYDVRGPRLWHERKVLEHIQGDVYVVATPDKDVFAEELGLMNRDLRGIRVMARPGIIPAGINAAETYRIPAWSANELSSIRDEARAVADRERQGLAGAVGGPAAAAALPVAAVGPLAAPVQAIGAPAVEHVAGVLKWLAAEACGGFSYAQEVPGVTAATVRGGKFVHNQDGRQIFVECVDGADLQQFLQRPALGDSRVLVQEMNSLGQPERSLKEVAAACREVEVKWVLSGPRTSKWCVNYLSIEGLGFEGHHERLRQITKADSSSWGIQEHFQVSMFLRQALLVDQVDAYNLLSIEVQFRRLQTIEFSYAEKAREQESKAVGGRLSLEEQTTFGGMTRQFSTLMVCPQLLDHVKLETEKEAALAKNLRKAREERDAARKNPKKGNQGKGSEDP